MRIAIIILSIAICLHSTAYAWTEYKNIHYMDMDGDLADEIIIESKYGAGSNHYIEDMRIFKDKYPNLDLVFTVRMLDSNFGFDSSMKQYNYDIISDVKFTEPNPKNGTRDIIVKSTKVSYKDNENKVIDKKEDFGIKIFKWDGMDFEEDNASYKVDLDNDGKEETIIVQRLFETIPLTKDSLPIQINSDITIFKSDRSKVGSFSMPDRMGEVEFVSLNNDGFKQIVAWSNGGMHYTNLAIYGYKNGELYEIFENGSACGIETDFKAKKPGIKVGSENWEKKDWCYADEPLWKVYIWNGKEFI